jgi:hypothetical protein
MFMDDATKQLSLGRVAAALILVILLAFDGHMMVVNKVVPDIPTGWLTAMLGFYFGNKASSTVTSITDIKASAGVK